MPVVESYTTQVPLSSTTSNILLGKKLNQAPGRGFYRILGRHAAAAGTVVMHAWRGSDNVADSLPMQAAAGGPNVLEDELIRFGVFGGETILIKLEETAGTATNPSIRIEFHSL